MSEASLEKLFRDSWGFFKNNFKTIFQISLLYIIPSCLLSIVLFQFLPSLESDLFATNPWVVLKPILAIMIPLLIVAMALGILMNIILIHFIDKNKKVKFNQLFKEVSGLFGKSLLLSLVLMIALIFLFILFIIPGIIFSVFWAFALTVLVIEKTGVLDSITESYKVVKGRWWKVFGYLFLIGLGTSIIGRIFEAGFEIILIPLSNLNIIYALFLIKDILMAFILGLLSAFVIIFTTKFYLALKKDKK